MYPKRYSLYIAIHVIPFRVQLSFMFFDLYTLYNLPKIVFLLHRKLSFLCRNSLKANKEECRKICDKHWILSKLYSFKSTSDKYIQSVLSVSFCSMWYFPPAADGNQRRRILHRLHIILLHDSRLAVIRAVLFLSEFFWLTFYLLFLQKPTHNTRKTSMQVIMVTVLSKLKLFNAIGVAHQ